MRDDLQQIRVSTQFSQFHVRVLAWCVSVSVCFPGVSGGGVSVCQCVSLVCQVMVCQCVSVLAWCVPSRWWGVLAVSANQYVVCGVHCNIVHVTTTSSHYTLHYHTVRELGAVLSNTLKQK